MKKLERSLFLALALAAGALSANPDLDGYLHLRGGLQVSGAMQKGSFPGGKVDFSLASSHVYGFELVAPLTEAISVVAALDAFSALAEDKTTLDSGLGSLKFGSQYSGQAPQLGVILYPAYWLHGLFVPGVGNPEGPLYTPILSARYLQSQGTIHNTVEATGFMVGITAPDDQQQREQGFGLGFDLPVFKRGTVYHQYQRLTWSQTYNDKASRSYSHPRETLSFGARYYTTLNAPVPLDPAEYLPRQGRPGSLVLDVGGGWYNALDGRANGQRFWWAEARHALDSRLALSLRWDRLTMDRGPYDGLTGFKPSDQNLNSDNIAVGLIFNFGSPKWRGKARETAVDAKPVGIPKELPEPVGGPADTDVEPKGAEEK